MTNKTILTSPREFAPIINYHKMPVVKIDLADSDEFGIKSEPVLIDNGTFDDGEPYYIRSEICAFTDEKKFLFCSGGTGISNSFTYHDMEVILTYANAPIIKKDSDILIAIIDSKNKKVYPPRILHTGKRIDAYCMSPLSFEAQNRDATIWLSMAGFNV